MAPWRTIIGSVKAKVVLALAIGISIPAATSLAGDLLWLHMHRAEAPEIIEAYRGDHYEIIQLKRAVQELIFSQKELVREIRQEREERIRESR